MSKTKLNNSFKKPLVIVSIALVAIVAVFASTFSGNLFKGNLSDATSQTISFEKCQLIKKLYNSGAWSNSPKWYEGLYDNLTLQDQKQCQASMPGAFMESDRFEYIPDRNNCIYFKQFANTGLWTGNVEKSYQPGTLNLCSLLYSIDFNNFKETFTDVPDQNLCQTVKQLFYSGSWSANQPSHLSSDLPNRCEKYYRVYWHDTSDVTINTVIDNSNSLNISRCKMIKIFYNSGLYSGFPRNPYAAEGVDCLNAYPAIWSATTNKYSNIPELDVCITVKRLVNASVFTGKYDVNFPEQIITTCHEIYDALFNSVVDTYQNIPDESTCKVVKTYVNSGLWTGKYDKNFPVDSLRACKEVYPKTWESTVNKISEAPEIKPTPVNPPKPNPAPATFSTKVIEPEQEVSKLSTKLTPRCKSFIDNRKSSSYYSAVEYVRKNAVFAGFEDCSFKGYKTINRAEVAKVILEAFDHEVTNDNTNYYSDVRNQDWFAKYANSAYQLGILAGYPDGTFKPAAEMNVAEFAKLFVNSSQLANQIDTVSAADYCVGYDMNAWFAKYLAVMVKNNLINKNNCRAAESITRNEVAQIFYLYSKVQ